MIIDFTAERAVPEADKLAIARQILDGFNSKIGVMFTRVSVEQSVTILARSISFDLGYYLKEDGVVKGAVLLGSHAKTFMRLGV